MADRDTSNNGEKDTGDREDVERGNGVPGAFGNNDKTPVGQTGVSHVRSDHDEIQPSEDIGKKDSGDDED